MRTQNTDVMTMMMNRHHHHHFHSTRYWQLWLWVVSVGVVHGFQTVIIPQTLPRRIRTGVQVPTMIGTPSSSSSSSSRDRMNDMILSFSAIPKDDTVTASTSPIRPPVGIHNNNNNINGDHNTTSTSTTTTTTTTTTGIAPTFTTVSSVVSSASVSSTSDTIKVPFWMVLWRFTRPHTLIGSALAIPSIHLLAAPLHFWSTTTNMASLQPLGMSIVYATIPALFMNLYITGLNQITDVDIDKINKPNLPIAAGILKQRDAIITVLLALITSLYMGMYGHTRYSTQGLQVALWGSGLLGTMYSLKPFRLKRYPVFAAFCIVAVRGAIINASFFAHAMAAVFQQPSATVLSCLKNDPRCLFSSIFFGIFGIVIAFMKDVPDVLGDKSSNVRTFSVRIGPERMFHMSRKLLMGLFYVCTAGFLQRAIVTASTSTPVLTMCRYMVAVACLVAAQSVRQQSKVVDPSNPSQVYQYYMHLWKIFYISYLMLPFAR